MNTREEIITLLSKSKKPLGPKIIAFELKKTSANIRKILSNLHKEGKIIRVGYGEYIASGSYLLANVKKMSMADKKEHLRQYNRQRYKDNKEKILKRVREYRKNNPEKERKRQRRNYRKKYKTDLKYTLNFKIRGLIKQSLKRGSKNGRHWETLVGYTLNDLSKRLKKTLPNGYTWQDFLSGELHIDHIIPISAFNFTSPEHTDFKRCWALSNLRLLPARENMIKNNHLDRPFQPALRI